MRGATPLEPPDGTRAGGLGGPRPATRVCHMRGL